MHQGSVKEGAIHIPMGDGGCNWVSVEDIGKAVAAAILTPEASNKLYRIDGPAPVTGQQLAAVLAAHTGHSVQFVAPAPEVVKEQLTGFGLPAPIADGILEMWAMVAAHKGEQVIGDYEKLVGSKPMSVAEWVEKCGPAWS